MKNSNKNHGFYLFLVTYFISMFNCQTVRGTCICPVTDYTASYYNLSDNIAYGGWPFSGMTGKTICVKDDLYIDADYYFADCTIYMPSGKNIYIVGYYTLSLGTDTKITLQDYCADIWEDIKVEADAAIICSGATIMYANNAIAFSDGANDAGSSIINTIFNKNITGINIEYVSGSFSAPIYGNTFECVDAYGNADVIGIGSYSTSRSSLGVGAQECDLTVGNGISPNSFFNLDVGISYKEDGGEIVNNYFEVVDVCVLSENYPVSPNSIDLVIDDNQIGDAYS